MSWLLAHSALPNLHPLVLHFPLALAPVALLLELAALFLPSRAWLRSAAATLWVLTAIGAYVARDTGHDAEHEARPRQLPTEIRHAIHEHEEAADWAFWLLLGTAVVRLVAAGVETDARPALGRGLRVLGLVVGGFGVAALVVTGDRGGRLVYRMGVAVSAPPASSLATAPVPPGAATTAPAAGGGEEEREHD